MGALLHVDVYYSDLREFLETARSGNVKVYGTMLDGEPVYRHDPGTRGVILFGNESRGVSADLAPYVTDRIMIPGPGNGKPGIDSLNVGMAASIILSEFRRREFLQNEGSPQ
jgi:TrmH family RNA methyltransferase